MYFCVNYKLIMFLNITTYSIVYIVLFFLEKKLSSKGLFFSELSAYSEIIDNVQIQNQKKSRYSRLDKI